jgi:hypothetical protein
MPLFFDFVELFSMSSAAVGGLGLFVVNKRLAHMRCERRRRLTAFRALFELWRLTFARSRLERVRSLEHSVPPAKLGRLR